MENAQLIGLSRQTALKREMDVIANNLANINTTGFKGQRIHFEEYLMPVAEATAFPTMDETLSYTQDFATSFDFAQGALRQTGNPLDLAIQGDGWLSVEGFNGEQLYTRTTSLHLSPQGELQTASGNPVLVDGAPLTIPTDQGPISVDKQGVISVGDVTLGKLSLVEFENAQQLTHQGDNLFTGPEPFPATNTSIVQGAIESSNVEGVTEITRMIEVTRNYASISKLISERNELQKKAIQQLGSIEA
ncbi:flagellar basal-body rod protein FlgF [Rhodobacteraceae bacterium RKSG542]|uniref:flagellar basal-body rod protein FlgF n=1 Tax=Pseudovibrio flavus TaxID=2529854 RepID=UPI0012BCE4DF|nr:flagellar basal-body rod protein FlgF [Pseudovibrio flavus]MTI19273.1 flagellar basal-body rod protein FlgF [Pseudovibrio flavus]